MKSRRVHWNEIHREAAAGGKAAQEALTGSDAATTLAQHSVNPRAETRVLDIGVGMGQMVRHLASLGCVVDCLDVADAGTKTVTPWARRFYAVKDIHMLPSREYDLALSHLTAQHMADPDLREQISEVGRALKPGGLFSLQLEGGYVPEMENYRGDDIPQGFDGAMCRTPEYALSMIAEVLGPGYTASLTANRLNFPAMPPESDEYRHGRQYDCYWYFIHIRRL